ncbi:hypothetical protein BDY24DRAFT_404518 [Mrakia frigida]|uniref:uncharacterized protein n=1 Tax=Mrakia frigida TaxID=29902 RepID=UPI003FCC082E
MKVLTASVVAATVLVSSTLASVSRPSPAQSIYGSVSPPGPSGAWILTEQEDRAHRRPSRPASTPSSIPSTLSPPIDYGGDPRIWFRSQGEAGEWVYIGEGVTRWEGESRKEVSRLIFCDFDGVERVTTIQVAGSSDAGSRPRKVWQDLVSVRENVIDSKMIYEDSVALGRTPLGTGLGGPRCDVKNPRPLDPVLASSSFFHSLLTFFGLASPPSPLPSFGDPSAFEFTPSFHWVSLGDGVLREEDPDAPIPAVRMVGGSVRSEVLLRFKDSTGKWRVIIASHGGGPPGEMRPVTTADDLRRVEQERAREKFLKDKNRTVNPSSFGQGGLYSHPPVAKNPIKYTYCDWEHQGPRHAPCHHLRHLHKNIAARLHSTLQRMTNEEAYIVALIFGVGLVSILDPRQDRSSTLRPTPSVCCSKSRSSFLRSQVSHRLTIRLRVPWPPAEGRRYPVVGEGYFCFRLDPYG